MHLENRQSYIGPESLSLTRLFHSCEELEFNVKKMSLKMTFIHTNANQSCPVERADLF